MRLMKKTIAVGYEKNLPVNHPEAFVTRSIPVPELRPHDLLVEVKAVSMNPVDTKLRANSPAEGFRVLGFDAAGTVLAVGSAVELFAPGDDVFYAGAIDRAGTNQKLHVVDERITGRKPLSMTYPEAAALPLTSITAWESMFDRLRLGSDSTGTLLVIGATGGVGSIMVQLAEALLPKVQVIASASEKRRAAWVKQCGAEFTVNHHRDLEEEVLAIAPQGVDWLFTAHSEGQISLYEKIVKPGGQIVAIDDGLREISVLKAKSIAWHWELMFTRSLYQTQDMIEQHRLLNAVADLADDGRINTTATLALTPISAENLRKAHELSEEGHVLGKIVLYGWDD